jgi:hypothetical protein
MKLFASFSSEGASVRRLLLLQVFAGVNGTVIVRTMFRPRHTYDAEKDGEYGHTGPSAGERTLAFQ